MKRPRERSLLRPRYGRAGYPLFLRSPDHVNEALACSAIFVKAALSCTARSARTLRSISISAFFAWTPVVPRNCRLFLVFLLVRMWRLNAIARLMLPLPRTRKRFFALDFVFILGMTAPFFAAHGGALRRRDFATGFGLRRVM